MSKNKEPQTDAEFRGCLSMQGYEVFDQGGYFVVVRIKGGGTTRLEADNYSSALFEAWNLVKP